MRAQISCLQDTVLLILQDEGFTLKTLSFSGPAWSWNHLFGFKWANCPKNLKTEHLHWSYTGKEEAILTFLNLCTLYVTSWPPYKAVLLNQVSTKSLDCCKLIKPTEVAGISSVIWIVSRLRIFIFQRLLWFLKSQTGPYLCTAPCCVLHYPLRLTLQK